MEYSSGFRGGKAIGSKTGLVVPTFWLIPAWIAATVGRKEVFMRISNPVYNGYFADPFVWKAGDEYFAIGTGPDEAGGAVRDKPLIFPLLRSRDLMNWVAAGDALERPDPALGSTFWAPEVASSKGRFWLYYSVGRGDARHQIRVAVSDSPLGPYRDARTESLVFPDNPPFAIDPHPFQDDDGTWYLFYARDFLDSAARSGTALAVDRLTAMDRVAGEGTTVLRARHDWQRFMANRPMYGAQYDWHTLEGPFVRKRGGRYFCFFSAGRWENDTYGVDYAVADSVLGPYSDAGNEAGPRVLRTIPGRAIGPGHNSIVAGPDGEDYLVYHAWDPQMTARRMQISRLDWTPEGPRCEAE